MSIAELGSSAPWRAIGLTEALMRSSFNTTPGVQKGTQPAATKRLFFFKVRVLSVVVLKRVLNSSRHYETAA